MMRLESHGSSRDGQEKVQAFRLGGSSRGRRDKKKAQHVQEISLARDRAAGSIGFLQKLKGGS